LTPAGIDGVGAFRRHFLFLRLENAVPHIPQDKDMGGRMDARGIHITTDKPAATGSQSRKAL
jgi:hypothetical protein